MKHNKQIKNIYKLNILQVNKFFHQINQMQEASYIKQAINEDESIKKLNDLIISNAQYIKSNLNKIYKIELIQSIQQNKKIKINKFFKTIYKYAKLIQNQTYLMQFKVIEYHKQSNNKKE